MYSNKNQMFTSLAIAGLQAIQKTGTSQNKSAVNAIKSFKSSPSITNGTNPFKNRSNSRVNNDTFNFSSRPVMANKSSKTDNSEKIAQATKDIDKATTTKNEVGTQQKL